MKLSAVTSLDAIAERIAQLRGECRYCGVTHPVRQCAEPKNWSTDEPMRSATAIAAANEAGEHGRYLQQLKRQIQRERVLSIKL